MIDPQLLRRCHPARAACQSGRHAAAPTIPATSSDAARNGSSEGRPPHNCDTAGCVVTKCRTCLAPTSRSANHDRGGAVGLDHGNVTTPYSTTGIRPKSRLDRLLGDKGYSSAADRRMLTRRGSP